MGVSMLVDAINNRLPAGATESTVLGPSTSSSHRRATLGDDIADAHDSPRCLVRGRVLDLDGAPVPGALVDVWQADDQGLYDVQKDATPGPDLRGLFTTDARAASGSGRSCRALPDPRRRPGRRAPARHRAPPLPPGAHPLHRRRRGHHPVTTHLFVEGSPYLDDDTVFGVKQSLVRPGHPRGRPGDGSHAGAPEPVPRHRLRHQPGAGHPLTSYAGQPRSRPPRPLGG